MTSDFEIGDGNLVIFFFGSCGGIVCDGNCDGMYEESGERDGPSSIT